MVQDGVLDGIPVKEGSLVVQGLKNMTWQEKHEHRTHQHVVHGLFVFFLLVLCYFILVHKTKNSLILRINTLPVTRVIAHRFWFYDSELLADNYLHVSLR